MSKLSVITLPTAVFNALAIGAKVWNNPNVLGDTRYYLTKTKARRLSGIDYEVKHFFDGEEVDAYDAIALTDTSYYVTTSGEVRASRDHPMAKKIAALIQAELDLEGDDA